jgi:Flp pilus assembly protein TadB
MNVKKRKSQHFFFIFFLVIASLIVIGCAKTFTRETSITKMSESEKAISVAKESNASIDAPADLKVALDKMTAAKKALQKEDYETATRMAEQASVDADYARVKAISDKAKKATEERRETVNTLRHEVERMPK